MLKFFLGCCDKRNRQVIDRMVEDEGDAAFEAMSATDAQKDIVTGDQSAGEGFPQVVIEPEKPVTEQEKGYTTPPRTPKAEVGGTPSSKAGDFAQQHDSSQNRTPSSKPGDYARSHRDSQSGTPVSKRGSFAESHEGTPNGRRFSNSSFTLHGGSRNPTPFTTPEKPRAQPTTLNFK